MKNISISLLSFILFICITSCKQKIKNNTNTIKNGIEIKESGLEVEKAFLTNGDGPELAADNKVQPGERICLRMTINGWKEKNGIVFMDASQTVSTNTGVTLTTNPSIFGITLFNGTIAESAKHVLLYQAIGKLDKPVDYILITFKVWDKLTDKSISGSYKVYMHSFSP